MSAHEALRPLIDERWHVAPLSALSARVVPDNCMDLMRRGERWWVVGPAPRAHVATIGPGEVVSGVRFHPGMLPLLTGLDARALCDLRVPLPDALGLTGEDEAALWRRLSAGVERAQAHPDYGLLMWMRDAPVRRAAHLTARSGWSERTLRRRLAPLLGYAPSLWLRVQRLRQALAIIDLLPLAEVASRAGYADQAHLSRDCRALTGLTPRQWRDAPR